MADRIYGPIRGAGTQVREQTPEKNIVPAQLGSTVLIGVLERGNEDDISICANKRTLLRKTGGLLDPADFNAASFASLEGPLNAQHFWDHSDGAGMQIDLRVVPKTNNVTNDDRPDKATLMVWNRENTPVILGSLTAKNGGRWAGQREQYLGKITGVPVADFPTDYTLQLNGVAAKGMKRDEWKGATVELHALTTKTYTVISNTSAGLLTFAADTDLPTDWAGIAPPPTDFNVTVYRDNLNARGQEKVMTAYWKDGTLDPVGTFGLTIKVDGVVLLDYEILSMDTNSPFYWKDLINNDPNNDLITVADVFTGNRGATTARPANRYGLSDAITTQSLTIADGYITGINSPVGAWVPTITAFTWGSDVVPQRLKFKVTDATPGVEHLEVSTDIGNRTYNCTGSLAVGIACATDKYMANVTIKTGSGVATLNDYFYVYLRPLYVNELVGGLINPKTNATTVKTYTIISNTRTVVSISALQDLTDAGTIIAGDRYYVGWDERFGAGYDGYVAGMATSDYEALLDPANSPLKKLKEMNIGLVKLAIPGIAKPSEALALQQKAAALCLAYNWEYRAELPDEYVSDLLMLGWVNNSLGRQDLTTIFVPTFMNIRDPLAQDGSTAREVTVSTVGMMLGREAMVARQWGGYHKASAGTEVTLPLVTSSVVLGRPDDPKRLDEELLNPAGLNAYRWARGGGSIIAWGDRTLDETTAFRWKHKREQLSHYENVIIENFDWAIFQINDPIADQDVLASMHSYFLEEYRKRAIRGTTFVGGRNPAAIIKMDEENNTDATRAQGDQNISVSLRFADTVERLKILIGAMGVTEVS